MSTTLNSNRPADIELPEGWTWDLVEQHRAKWDIARNMVPVASAGGAVTWGTINSARIARGDSPIQLLVHEYTDWQAEQGLKLGSADEHLYDRDLRVDQLDWLKDFVRRWDEAVETEEKMHEVKWDEKPIYVEDDMGTRINVHTLRCYTLLGIRRAVRRCNPGRIEIHSPYDCTGLLCHQSAKLIKIYRPYGNCGYVALLEVRSTFDV